MVAVGKERYNPDDEKQGLPFNFDYGADLALKRMLEEESNKKNKVIKQERYEVGDKVMLNTEDSNSWEYFSQGASKYYGTLATIAGAMGDVYLIDEDRRQFKWRNEDIKDTYQKKILKDGQLIGSMSAGQVWNFLRHEHPEYFEKEGN